ncbi:MAG: large subunit ribosomal protein L25 [Candidatus Saccharimonadales bacterium]|jgi:large subunit ribosomal protein L25
MSDNIELIAEKRVITGKKVRSIRAEGYIPATVYEKGKESINIRVPYIPLQKAYSAAGQGQPVYLTVEKEKYLTMIKDVHMDPAKNTIMHVAFHAVNKNDPVEAEIPVHIEGEVPAEQQGNFIVRPNDHVLVKALPANLPEVLNVLAASLLVPGDHLTVADIAAVENVEFLSEPEMVLATVEEPRAVEEEPEVEEGVDAADVPSDNGGAADEESSEESKSKSE